MPYLWESSYSGNKWLKGSHLETIVPALFRKINIPYQRERLILPDGDFLDLDFVRGNHPRLLVLFHGLEGSTSSSYIKGMARMFTMHGWDICCVNFRSCSGVPNHLLRSYHSGATEDVHAVMNHLQSIGYTQLAAGGFSLGGNVLLKYLGEGRYPIPAYMVGAFAYSVPIDLGASSLHMAKVSNRIYMYRFLKSLRAKMIQKSIQFPGSVLTDGISSITSFAAFDNRYTAPLNGFKDAAEYYTTCNALQFLPHIQVPTLLVNAVNDPFLTPSCFPTEVAKHHAHLYFEAPQHGGHVGFSNRFPHETYWSETRALNFISSYCH